MCSFTTEVFVHTDGTFAGDIHGVSRTTEWYLVVPVHRLTNVAHADRTHWSKKQE